jgi:hypothetical protein
MDAERYKMHYDTMVGAHAQFSPSQAKEEAGNVCMLWQKLLDIYIRPNSSKEVNLPAAVRDRLLSLSYKPSVPDPAELDSASKIIYDLYGRICSRPLPEFCRCYSSTGIAESMGLGRTRDRLSNGRLVGRDGTFALMVQINKRNHIQPQSLGRRN